MRSSQSTLFPFPLKYRREETIFLLNIQISWNIWKETISTTLLDNDLDLLSPFKPNYIRLGLVNSHCIQKIPNFATNNIWFFTDHIIWSKEIELTKLDCITNCLKGRIYCESFLSNYFVKYYINVNVTVYLNIKFQLNCFFKLSWNISIKKVLAFQKQKISSSEIVFQKRLPHAPLILLF